MQCQVNNEMMNNFRTYTMDKAISDSMDEDLSKVTGSGDSSLDMTQVSNPVDGAATICVDAGHPPTGAPGEPEYNLKTAKALQTELQNRGYKVIMTRTDSGDVSIAARPKKCLDGKANLLYSIHGENDGVAKNHPFTIYMKDGRSQSAKSKSYAKTIQDAITSSLAGSHGMKGEQGICMEGSCTAVKNLGVFSGADAGGLPAVLSEVVRSNDDGTSAIDDPAYLKKLVTGIANGIQKIFPLPAPPKVAYA
jgi:N-acetylmuramoyl-L-alanine amidase